MLPLGSKQRIRPSQPQLPVSCKVTCIMIETALLPPLPVAAAAATVSVACDSVTVKVRLAVVRWKSEFESSLRAAVMTDGSMAIIRP